MRSPYEILGVAPSATSEEIKLAFKRAAMKYHPDREGGSAEMFNAAKAAYQLLDKRPCPECGGVGFVKTRMGFFVEEHPCKICWRIK